MFRPSQLGALSVAFALAATVAAGDLVNDTKEVIPVQLGVRNPQSGVFSWSQTVYLKPGNFVTIPPGQWYRHDTHVGDGKETFSLPSAIGPNDPRDYFFLFGNEVRIDVVKK